MKRLLLISSNKVKPAISPLGLEYVAESLLNRGYGVDLIDMCLEEDPEKTIEKKIRNNDYLAIGIGIRNIGNDALSGNCITTNFLPEIKSLISKIKKLTGVPVILGGVSFSLEPEKILKCTEADYGVDGCGIPALEILLKKIERKKVKPGTIFKYDPKKYLDFSFKRNILDLKKYPGYHSCSKGIGVNTKSICGLNCIYCPYLKIGARLRLREPLKVVDEIENLAKRGIGEIIFADEIFNAPRDHAQRICDEIIKRNLSIRWSAALSPLKKHLPEKLIRSMVRSGLFVGRLKISSGSNKILKISGKNYRTEDVEYVTRILKKWGVKVFWLLVFGAPGESKETIVETFKLVDKLNPDEVITQIGLRIYESTKFAKFVEGRRAIMKKSNNFLKPVFYPFKLMTYVTQEKQKRKNCH